MSVSAIERASEHWSSRPTTGRRRWWSHPRIHAHINRIVCGEAIGGAWAGLNRRIAEASGDGGLARGVSVGCGNAQKELAMLAGGLVGSFDLYEISRARLDDAAASAERLGVTDRVRLHRADAIEEADRSDFDLVYWNNALHHMLDVPRAVRWSRERLRAGGLFVMDDFVGSDRFQWPDEDLELASRVRELLPERIRAAYLKENHASLRVRRPNERRLVRADPTEAADSGRIIESVLACFPGCDLRRTGGVVYHLALNDVLAHFDDVEDAALLDALLLLDESLAQAGRTHYAVAIGRAE